MTCTNLKKDFLFLTTTGDYVATMPLSQKEMKRFEPKMGKRIGFKNNKTGTFDDYKILEKIELCSIETNKEFCRVVVEPVVKPEKDDFQLWLEQQGLIN